MLCIARIFSKQFNITLQSTGYFYISIELNVSVSTVCVYWNTHQNLYCLWMAKPCYRLLLPSHFQLKHSMYAMYNVYMYLYIYISCYVHYYYPSSLIIHSFQLNKSRWKKFIFLSKRKRRWKTDDNTRIEKEHFTNKGGEYTNNDKNKIKNNRFIVNNLL